MDNNSSKTEFEKTFLIKYLPKGLLKCKFKKIIDIYIPKNNKHPKFRLRKLGNYFELTKKSQPGNNASIQHEHTIVLNEAEYQAFSNIDGKRLEKIRYYYPYENTIAEIDIYTDKLKGLVTVDFEFKNNKKLKNFQMPKFCLVDASQIELVAAGYLAGKSYTDIKLELTKLGYKKITSIN
jgi:CYTH domain-containing protein